MHDATGIFGLGEGAVRSLCSMLLTTAGRGQPEMHNSGLIWL
jgi:hypothetical protein